MKKHLISLLRDFGIEPTFLTISISILLIIGITFIVIHLVLHKVILKSINKPIKATERVDMDLKYSKYEVSFFSCDCSRLLTNSLKNFLSMTFRFKLFYNVPRLCEVAD
mgnify:CR=1 FL=1